MSKRSKRGRRRIFTGGRVYVLNTPLAWFISSLIGRTREQQLSNLDPAPSVHKLRTLTLAHRPPGAYTRPRFSST